MEIITITPENLDAEHICCAISNNNDCQVAAKKEWLRAQLREGLVFKKSAERGKCFIEYLPAEKAWAPIDAPNYMYIDCLWVSGKLKGHGYSGELLDECLRDSRAAGKAGIAVLSSPKKLAFLSDPGFLAHKGFSVADSAAPYFTLQYLPLLADAQPPRFRPCVKTPCAMEAGFTLYYAHQCPYTAKYVPLLAAQAQRWGAPFQAIRFTSAAQAQNAPAPFTSFALFCDGQFVTHEIPSEKKFEALLTARGYAAR